LAPLKNDFLAGRVDGVAYEDQNAPSHTPPAHQLAAASHPKI